eukprot:CAMPEP_0119367524 /NCGR_PEP_ID=MMETSP1334-20130426/14299_1 /TAXON_ID=127549 /ORGANISM="Calcidiscus leptoporus, Strain RCC1130" /LENGTH=407 /DNA_ID=CAMNT_0007383947 /DNA_START=45 /DNA_END=1268 /DNA_ORIENTATION=+
MRRDTVLATVLVLATFATRSLFVGPVETFFELLGVSNWPIYVEWRDAYSALHRPLQAGVLRDEWLDERLAGALRNTTHRDEALRGLVRREGAGVFTLPLLSQSFCEMLAEELAHYAAWQHGAMSPPNEMNDYGVVLSELGLGALMEALREHVLRPLAVALYARTDVDDTGSDNEAAAARAAAEAGAAACCDEHHAFTVRYAADEQPGLDMHHDDSDVTLNVCISATGRASAVDAQLERASRTEGSPIGSSLSFCGVVGHVDHRRFRFTLEHRVGVAVLHLGAQRHGVHDIVAGTRQNLIMWGRVRHSSRRTANGARLHPAELPPDERCLSWTHDGDYVRYRELPLEGVRRAKEREQMRQLLEAVHGMTDAQLEYLPAHHRPIMRMLRDLDSSQRDHPAGGPSMQQSE